MKLRWARIKYKTPPFSVGVLWVIKTIFLQELLLLLLLALLLLFILLVLPLFVLLFVSHLNLLSRSGFCPKNTRSPESRAIIIHDKMPTMRIFV